MAPAERPNVVVILTDDQGYGDLSCMGATDFRTPNLDRLAASGVRFTDWYSNSPVCSPSRASLLTGRYPGNAGVRAILDGHRTASGLLPEVFTIATVLKPLGYRCYMSGKWHLGLARGCRPQDHGFDHWFGFMAGCVDYYSHIFYWGLPTGTNPIHDLWDDDHEVWLNGQYLTEVITSRAIDYIRHARSEATPFFLYVAYNAPHYPMHAPDRYMARFAHLPWDRQVMAAMISAVDDGVGDILDELDRQRITDSTLVFFTSDNGPSREARNWLDGTVDPYYGGTSGVFKGHKFSLFEGGLREPTLMSWPARIPAGQVVREPLAAMDLLPTLLAAAGGDPTDYELDGCDVLPCVTAGAPSPHARIFWEMDAQTAVRQGNWKLVLNGVLVEGAAPADAVHLADLANDPGERHNLADRYPEVTAELTAAAEAWRAGIEARWAAYWLPRLQGTTTHAGR